jgi:hypothetical protein
MIDQKCVQDLDVSNILLGPERGRSANICNPERLPHRKIKIDGCVQWEGLVADWAVERDIGVVIVELKGRNVEHGAKQVIATATKWIDKIGKDFKVAGLIVGRQVPAATTSIQIKKQEFARKFGGPLHVVNANCDYRFEHIHSFKGPFKA